MKNLRKLSKGRDVKETYINCYEINPKKSTECWVQNRHKDLGCQTCSRPEVTDYILK